MYPKSTLGTPLINTTSWTSDKMLVLMSKSESINARPADTMPQAHSLARYQCRAPPSSIKLRTTFPRKVIADEQQFTQKRGKLIRNFHSA